MRRLFYLGCAAGLALLAAMHSTRVAREGRELVALKEELRNLEAENRRLEAEVLELQSLARIEREATGRLGMVRPPQVAPVPAAGAFTRGGHPGRVGAVLADAAPRPYTVSVPLPPPPGGGDGGGRPAQAGAAPGGGIWRGPAGALRDLGHWLTRRFAGR